MPAAGLWISADEMSCSLRLKPFPRISVQIIRVNNYYAVIIIDVRVILMDRCEEVVFRVISVIRGQCLNVSSRDLLETLQSK